MDIEKKSNINIERFQEFILYEEYAINDGGNIEMILNFIEWIKKKDLIKKTKINSYDIFNLFVNNKKINYKNINSKISDYNKTAKDILNNKYCYIPLLLPKHLIGIFIFKVETNNYDISIINTGAGCVYQKIFNKDIFGKKINFTNGIIMYRNINYDNLIDFIEYILFLENQQNRFELNLEMFNELIYTSLSDKISNFFKINFDLDVSEKTLLFELPTQIIGDCSLKSFIYSLILMDFYGLVNYNILDYKFDIDVISVYTKENIHRSLENYWNLYYEFFINLINNHVDTINNSKDLRFENIEKQINSDLSSLYIIQEKNYNNNSLYKFYSSKDLKKFNQTNSNISNLIIDLSKKNLNNYNDSLKKKIEEKDFNYWINFPDVEYIKHHYNNDKKNHEELNNLESLCKLTENLHLMGKELKNKYKNTSDTEFEKKNNLEYEDDENLGIILSKMVNNLEMMSFNEELYNFSNYLNIYGIYKKILEFLFETKLIIYSYKNYLLVISFFETIIDKIDDNIDIRYLKNKNNLKIDFKNSTNSIINLIYSFILIKINDYKVELLLTNKGIYKLLFFPEFNKTTEKNLNQEIVKKFISKKFFKKEIFDQSIDKYITWIQDYFQSELIQFNLILFTKKNYSELDKFLLNNYDKNDNDEDMDISNLSNYMKIINFINDIRDSIVKDNNFYDDWTNYYKNELNTNDMFDKIINFDENSIKNLTSDKSHYISNIYNHKKKFMITKYYKTNELINDILSNYNKYIEKKIIKYLEKNKDDNIIKLLFTYIDIEFNKSKDDKINIFYLRCLDFVNPYEKDDLEQENYEENDKYDDDYYYGGSNLEKNNVLTGGLKYTCNYGKIKNTPIDIHYLVECVSNSIIPDILQESYSFIQHNYYVKNIDSRNKVFENNISSYKLFEKYMKKNLEKNISSYLDNILKQIPLTVDCIGLIIISCQLFLFCHSTNVQIQNFIEKIKYIYDYIKIYLDDNNIDLLIIKLYCYISLLVGIDNRKINYSKKRDITNAVNINDNYDTMKKKLIENIMDILNKINIQSGFFSLDEKYLWYLISVPDIFIIINSLKKKYEKANSEEIYKYSKSNLQGLNLYESNDSIYIEPSKNSYNSKKIKSIKLIIDKSTNKLYNYISYYCYLLTNFFIWNKISKKYTLGKLNSSYDLFAYSILYNYYDNKYYKVNLKNIDLIIDSINLVNKEAISDEKLDNYIKECQILLDKEEIINLINTYENLKCLINKLNKFIQYEQIIFWKNQNDLSTQIQIQIEIPEYKISFIFKPEANGIFKFKNYDVEFDYDKKETLLFFNLVSNVPNLFLLKNSQDDEYYFLNMSNLFYWDIIKIHYSGLFILFENDITLLNYISSLKNYGANHIALKNIKNNITFQKIFNKNETNINTNTNNIEEQLKKNILKDTKNLYDRTIIDFTNSNYTKNIYKEYVINLDDLVNGYLNKINRLWKKFNLPLIFEIPEFYTWKKIFFDSVYFNNLYFFENLINDNNILKLIFYENKFKYTIENYNKLKNRKKYTGNYYSDYDSDYYGGGDKTSCEIAYDFTEPLETDYINELKKIYLNDKTNYGLKINFTENSIKCFIETFFVEKQSIYTNTLKILNMYLDDYIDRFKKIHIDIEKNKKELIGGGLPVIPDLYLYKSYQDHLNINSVILIEFVNKNNITGKNKDNNVDNTKIITGKNKNLINMWDIWDRWDFTTINSNPYDIKITHDIIKSLDSYDFISYINRIINIYNDKIVDLFYNSTEFRYICLLFLFRKLIKNNQINDKKHINSTLSLLFYQFLMGGLVKDEQIKIISSILGDYGFSNTYLDLIKNTYDTDKKCIYKDLIKSGLEKSCLFSDNRIFYTDIKRNIYNLIMGSGKTKFITPIICIYVCELIKNIMLDKNILIILPPKLINQSKIFLSYILEYFLNIEIEQIEKYNLNMLNSSETIGKLLLCSDENIKYYFLGIDKNNFDYINWNPSKNIVLIDEADIILDPMSSEMNYPIEESKKFLNFKIYLQIVNIIFKMFTSDIVLEAKNILIKEAKILDFDIELYIDFIDFIKSHNNSNNNPTSTDKLFDLYKKTNPNSNIEKLKNINYDTYCFYDYIYNIYISVDTVWNMVNRKDFGFASENNELVTPFKYSETPIIGSEFNGIFINMMLTIKAYLYDTKISFYKLCKLMKYIITKLKNININKYKSNQYYKFIEEKFKLYEIPNILFKFNIDLSKIDNIDNLKNTIKNLGLDSSIDMLVHDKDVILMYCKFILYHNLYYYKKQLNISGIDITFSQFFNFVSGFTGTPEDKFEYIDLNPLVILKKNPKSICLERDAMKLNVSVINYKIDFHSINKFTENYDYKNFVLTNITNYTKYNVLIDVGSVFINSTFYELAELFFNFFEHIERFIFIDNNDEIFYIDKKNIMSIIPWDYSIFNSDLVFFDNSHTTGIDFILPDKFIGLITIRANTRYRDFIQGLYRLRKINSTQKADIFILPNVFVNPIVTNQLVNLLIFDNDLDSKDNNINIKINTINNVNIVNTNLKIDDIIRILEINEEYYFINQKYYFNIQQLRVIKTFNKFINSEKNPNEILDTFNKVTNGFEDYINDKIIIEINDINKNFIANKKDYIEKYFSKNYMDILNKICNIIQFYKKIDSDETIQNISIQLQIQTQEQYQNTVEISVQTQIKKTFSNGNPYNRDTFDFDNLKSSSYNDFLEIDKNSYLKEKTEINNESNYYYDFKSKDLIYSYLIKKNNYNENISSDTYIFTLSSILLLSNQTSIKYDNNLYIFNNFLIIFIKNKNENENIFKAGEFYEILNISNYYKNINIQHIIFDVFGNIIENYNMIPNEYELSLIANIKLYFSCVSLDIKSYRYQNVIYTIPNYKSIFNYNQVQKLICSSENNIMAILDILESMNLPKRYLVFDLSKINYCILLTIVLILLRSDPLLFSNNIDVNKFIKNNFIPIKNNNLESDFYINIVDGVRKYWNDNIFTVIDELYESDNTKYKLCDKNNFKNNEYDTVDLSAISKCVGKILKKNKIWEKTDNKKLKKSLTIFKIIIRLFVPVQDRIKFDLFENLKLNNLHDMFEKYFNFINLIQDDAINLIDMFGTIDNFFNS